MKYLISGVVLVVAIGTAGWIAHSRGVDLPWIDGASTGDTSSNESPSDDTEGAAKEQPLEVRALGRLEPAGGILQIAALPGDCLASVEVGEGDVVEAGAVLAKLKSGPLRKLQLRAAEAQYGEAKTRLEAEKSVAAFRVKAAELVEREAKAARTEADAEVQQDQLALLGKRLEQAESDRRRAQGVSEEVVSRQQREKLDLAVDKAQADLDAAMRLNEKTESAQLLAVEAAGLELTAARDAQEYVAAAIPVASLEKARDLALLQYQRTEIKAPCAGTILKIWMRPGEMTGATPILQMADLRRMVVVAEVYKADVKHIGKLPWAWIESPAIQGDGLWGKVSRVGTMVATPAMRPVDPFRSSDRHAVEVRIELVPEAVEEAARFSNLQVNVTFKATQGEGGP